jgi:hypothetical protein
MTDTMTEAEKQADGVGSYDDAIRKMRTDFLSNRLDIAVEALIKIKCDAATSNGPTIQRIFVTSRDALDKLERNPATLKRG